MAKHNEGMESTMPPTENPKPAAKPPPDPPATWGTVKAWLNDGKAVMIPVPGERKPVKFTKLVNGCWLETSRGRRYNRNTLSDRYSQAKLA